MPKDKQMTGRVSCTIEVRNALREICKGANIDYDDLLRYFLDMIEVDGESPDPVQALKRGLELRGEILSYKDDPKKD